MAKPIEDLGETELLPAYRAVDKCVSVQTFDFNIKAVAPQKYISGRECDALVAVEKPVVVS